MCFVHKASPSDISRNMVKMELKHIPTFSYIPLQGRCATWFAQTIPQTQNSVISLGL